MSEASGQGRAYGLDGKNGNRNGECAGAPASIANRRGADQIGFAAPAASRTR